MAMIKKVGVIGSGQMGNGIAHVAAGGLRRCVLNDVSAERLEGGMATINGNMARQVAKSDHRREPRQALGRIKPARDYDALADCDLVIETAIEKEEVKRKIFHDLCPVLKPEALIVASNTSSISITRLAAPTDRPERFIGIHFMNPVPLMELVELIRGIATDDATFEAAKEFVSKLGKRRGRPRISRPSSSTASCCR